MSKAYQEPSSRNQEPGRIRSRIHTKTETQGRESGFKSLRIWQMSMEIAKEVYRLSQKFPAEEKFGLTAQVRRAAVSVPSNIAEGYGRKNEKEFKQFLHVSLGSLAELETQCLLALNLGFLEPDVEFFNLLEISRRMILKVCHYERFILKGEKNEN